MIWDFIRDFFVQYIFGGVTSNGTNYSGIVGKLSLYINGEEDTYTTVASSDSLIKLFGTEDGYNYYVSLGDWLSTTMTIICMVLISICFILLVRWLFKAVASAFLLK